MKVNQKQFIESAAFSAGATVGAMGPCVAADKFITALKSGAVKHGLLRIVGVVVAAFTSPEDNATKFVQSADVSIAATQLTATLKAVVAKDGKRTMEEGITKTALGSPETEVVYVDSTPSFDYYPYWKANATTTTQPAASLNALSQFVEV